MRKVNYGLLAGMAAAVMLTVTACGNSEGNSSTSTPTPASTTGTTTGTTSATSSPTERITDNHGEENNGGLLEDIGTGIEDGVEELGTDLGIDGTDEYATDGIGTDGMNGTNTGTVR